VKQTRVVSETNFARDVARKQKRPREFHDVLTLHWSRYYLPINGCNVCHRSINFLLETIFLSLGLRLNVKYIENIEYIERQIEK